MQMKIAFFKSNTTFLNNLEKFERRRLFLLLLIQLILYAYLLVTIPLHYDEWFSWRFFSGTDFFKTFSNYPAPNNHIFYNLVARCFILTGIDVEIATRIPSLLASLLTSYYFYKICKLNFSQGLSLVLLLILIAFDHFIFYSISARGYSFVNLFCVWLIYSSMLLSVSYSGFKNRLLFILSQSLGLFTVPSFLYVMLPVGIILFTFLIIHRILKQVFRLAQDYVITLALVVLGYSGILFLGDPSHLLNPEIWTNKFTFNDPEWFNNLMFYLDTRFFDIFGFYKLKTTSLLVIFTAIYYLVKGKASDKFAVILFALMFFSPLFIVLLHKVYPFGRTFYYLLIPGLLLLGFIINPILLRIKYIPVFLRLIKYRNYIFLLLLSFSIAAMLTFTEKNRESMSWEYHLDWLRRNKLKYVMSQYNDISRTNVDFEFYPAEIISFMCAKEIITSHTTITLLDSIKKQDVLIIAGSEKPKFINHLKNYQLIFEYNDIWIYQSDKIKPVGLIYN